MTNFKSARRRSQRPWPAWRFLLAALLVLASIPALAVGSPAVDRTDPGLPGTVSSAASGDDRGSASDSLGGGEAENWATPLPSIDSEEAARDNASAHESPVPSGSEIAAAPVAEPRAAGDPLYVSAAGSDLTGDGTYARPYATLGTAVSKVAAGGSGTITIVGNLTATTTAAVADKTIVVNGEAGQSAASVVTATTAVTLFAVTTGSLTLSNVTFDGAATSADHRVADVSGTGGRLVLAAGLTVKNWYSNGVAGAFRLRATGASAIMLSGSTITGCRLVARDDQSGGAAISVMAGRSPGSGTAPSSSFRASFTMQSGASIIDCDTQMTSNATLAGGGAIHAADSQVSIQAGASLRNCDLTYRNALGLLFDPTLSRQGGGALFANNCKLEMAGTIDSCTVVSSVNVTTGNFYAGGGALYLYNYGCTTALGIDCRAVVSGTVANCSAIAGGGVFYWSEADGYGEGDNLWVGASNVPLSAAAQVVDKVYDALTLSGSIANCSTTDAGTLRTITLATYADFERYGVGGGAICGAYNGLIVLASGSKISGCSTYSEGGGVSNYGVSVFCLDDTADLSAGPTVEQCTSGVIAGGISLGAGGHIENVTVNNCAAGSFGGGIYAYSGSTTMYNAHITGCSAGVYGGGIMQHVVHDLFLYGGTITGNHAVLGGGGIALYGFANGSAGAPRGLVCNYPPTMNGGYTNPTFYKTAILTAKIAAPTVISANTQAITNSASNVWTTSLLPISRIMTMGPFVDGSKAGVTISDGLPALNAVFAQFGTIFQTSASLAPFANDTNPTLVATSSGNNMIWADGFVVDYRANAPVATTLIGAPPFDGIAGILQAYLRTGGSTTILGSGTMAAGDYTFLGWSTDPAATAPQFSAGASLSYNASLDPDLDGRIVLYAVWQAPRHVCQIIRDTNGDGTPDAFYKAYATVYEAFRDARSNDRVEMIRDAPIVDFTAAADKRPTDGRIALGAGTTGVVLTTAPLVQTVPGASGWQGLVSSPGAVVATLTRTASGSMTSSFGVAGGLTLRALAVDGACAGSGGISGASAVFEGAGSGSSLTLDTGAIIRNACNANGSGGAVNLVSGATATTKAGSVVDGCSARDGGGIAAAGSTLNVQGGIISNCRASRYGGGVYAGLAAATTIAGATTVQGNVAGRSGGGAYVDATGRLVLTGGSITANACSATDSDDGAYAGAYVGGIGHARYTGGTAPIAVAGTAVVSGNVGRVPGSSAATAPTPSDTETARAGGAYSLAVAAPGMALTAAVGVTSADPTLLASHAQFASYSGTAASSATNLQTLFNDSMAVTLGTAGGGQAIVWRAARVDVSFTKVGPDQATGKYVKLAGATFSVYRYAGLSDLTSLTINSGSIDLASLSSTQWAPVIAADGTEGTPGNPSNVPYAFTSSSQPGQVGNVLLTQLVPGAWYMLVETAAPVGYQKAVGQWAFKARENPLGSNAYTIDTTTLLARKDSNGIAPPALMLSVTTGEGVLTGVFVANAPLYNLPFAGAPAFGALSLLGIALILLAVLLYRKRRISR